MGRLHGKVFITGTAGGQGAAAADRLGEPADVARVALFLASDDATCLNVVDIVVEGGQPVIV